MYSSIFMITRGNSPPLSMQPSLCQFNLMKAIDLPSLSGCMYSSTGLVHPTTVPPGILNYATTPVIFMKRDNVVSYPERRYPRTLMQTDEDFVL